MTLPVLKPGSKSITLPGSKGFPATPPAKAAPERRYPEADVEFFKEAVRQAQMDTLFGNMTLDDKLLIKFKRKFETACWAYLPPHRVYLGLDLFQKDMVKPDLSEELQRKYIANHFHHERGHGLFTTRDMKKVNATLKLMSDCPFSLYNLFEDAYMEHAYRREENYQFEWLTMENLSFNTRPESIFFALIQAEGDVAVVEKALNAWKPPAPAAGVLGMLLAAGLVDKTTSAALAALTGGIVDEAAKAKGAEEIDGEESDSLAEADPAAQLKEWFPKVALFYARAVSVKESMQLMPIIKAWIDLFGLPPKSDSMSDLQLGSMLGSPEFLEDFDKDSEPLEEDPGDQPSPDDVEPDEREKPPEAAKGSVLSSDDLEDPVDMAHADRIAEMMRKLFEQHTARVMTDVPQKRVSARNYALGRPAFVQRKTVGRGKKKLLLLVDCSGSMGGGPMASARVLVAALSKLAKENAVEGHVVFTGEHEDKPAFETYALPLATATLERVGALHGSEGLEGGLRDNFKLAQEADHVMVYTDANITDQPINKQYLHERGISTWGLYVGGNSTLNTLLKYFDKALIRDTLDELVDAMLTQIK